MSKQPVLTFGFILRNYFYENDHTYKNYTQICARGSSIKYVGKIVRKIISYPDMDTYVCVSGGGVRNVYFSENTAYALNGRLLVKQIFVPDDDDDVVDFNLSLKGGWKWH